MALQVNSLTRQFTMEKDGAKKIDLPDPNPSMTPEEVLKFYSSNYPELTNAVIQGPTIVGGKAVYKASMKAGKLG